ncbi:MAG: NAD(P)/FAD-dependent oxidoreductase [Nitrospira sp.]|nr:NAD(P)/FAD-dependent oxidoreductase [Nitrospira sp.]
MCRPMHDDGRDRVDIAIVGAGAAGLAAGIFAAEAAAGTVLRIVLLDSARTIGAKILISGGGRCNVTHESVHPEDFSSLCGTKPVIRNILAAFTERATREWFASLEVELKREESGKLFPVTDKARTILKALTDRCQALKVPIWTQHRVLEVHPSNGNGFLVLHEQGTLPARLVILATGGKSLPRSGSDGHGWKIVQGLGHKVTSTYPALVPLLLEDRLFHASLTGLSQQTEVTTLVDGKVVDRRSGSLLWTHFGVSGPVVMDTSRFWTIAHADGKPVEVRCNFWPGVNREEAERRLIEQVKGRPKLALSKLLAQQIPERLAEALCRACDIDPESKAGQLGRASRRTLVEALTGLVLPVRRDRGWNYAEVTAGGVPLEEINFRTMESRIRPGLYLIGEMLDCDGRIGGFNFQWAWATGYLAGRGAAAAFAVSGQTPQTGGP